MRRTLRHDRQALGIYLYVSITEPPKYPHPWHLHLASQTWPTDPGSSALLVMHRSLVYRGNVLG